VECSPSSEPRSRYRTALERSHEAMSVERSATRGRASTRCPGLSPVALT
jgi:hypothetical protein